MNNTKQPLETPDLTKSDQDLGDLPSWQDLLDMLASWCELATEAQLPFQVKHYAEGAQLQVVVDGIDVTDGGDGTHLVTIRS